MLHLSHLIFKICCGTDRETDDRCNDRYRRLLHWQCVSLISSMTKVTYIISFLVRMNWLHMILCFINFSRQSIVIDRTRGTTVFMILEKNQSRPTLITLYSQSTKQIIGSQFSKNKKAAVLSSCYAKMTTANITRCVIVIDDHEASPSSSDCMTMRSDTRSPVSWR